MAIVQITGEALVQDMEMKADAANLQEDIVVIAAVIGEAVVVIGEVEVVKVAVAAEWDLVQEMEADVDNQDMEIVPAAIGEVEAARAVVAVIPAINISEEDNPDAMIITSLGEAVEMEAVKVHAGAAAVQVLLQAGAAGAAAIDNLFSKKQSLNKSV